MQRIGILGIRKAHSRPCCGTNVAFQYEDYTLHAREVRLKGGRKQVVYFFSRRSPKSGYPVELPEGYDVATNKRTGLPYLRMRS